MNVRQLPQTWIVETMGRLSCFSGLSPECLSRLGGGARQCGLAAGEPLYIKGAPALAIHVLVSGHIRKVLPLANGAEKTLGQAAPGDSLGVAEAFLGVAHPASAIARTDCHLLAIDREVLLRQASLDAGLSARLLKAVSRRVLSLLQDMESCTPRSSLQRVSCFLLQHRPGGHSESYEIVLPSSKREIAAKLNIAQETLSRVFHQLDAEGAIKVEGRLIRVYDSGKLMALNLAGCLPGKDDGVNWKNGIPE
jgi:CRP-like cAMP-binding protein